MTRSDHQLIVDGLTQPRAQISPKYFYDQRGSELFEAITRLPEYYLTRTEQLIMQTYGGQIAQRVGAGCTLIEPGAGNCSKALALAQWLAPAWFVAVDISADFVRAGVANLQQALPQLQTRCVAADLTQGLSLPADVPAPRRLVFYPGSSLGNFDPAQALALLRHMRALLDADGGLLLGVDLQKDPWVLEAAYNDAAQVTAAFNLNVLSHINQLIGADFDLGQWQHFAYYNVAQSRIEMHLQASQAVRVSWPGGHRNFVAGERIHTENSYKYSQDALQQLLTQAGFADCTVWTDPKQWFAVVHARPTAPL